MRKIKKYVTKISENNYDAILAYHQDSKPIAQKSAFSTHSAAMDWLEEQIANKELTYETMSFYKLAMIVEKNPNNKEASFTLKDKIEDLKMQMIYTLVFKEDLHENEARRQVNLLCGKKWSESFSKAKDKSLDALESLEIEKSQQRASSLAQSFMNSIYQGSEEAQIVLGLIRKIPGKKILTTIINDEAEMFDIDENGYVGYEDGHENVLLKKFDMALTTVNLFTIRQFIPNTSETIINKGKKISIPWKAIYSFILNEDAIIPIDADEVEHAFTHDENDQPIEVENFVIYKDFSELL